MSKEEDIVPAHPEGEVHTANQATETDASLDTFAGKIHVKWAPEATVSSLGLMPYFIEFLKTSGLFDKWVEDCPLHYTSGNAPEKRNVLGTLLLSVLAGHWRYAHINAIRGDGINPELLGMTGVASEDSVRRGMKAMDEKESAEWMKRHLKASYGPLLQEPWVLDVDTTVKPLYGHACVRSASARRCSRIRLRTYRITRPSLAVHGTCASASHAYHSYFVANTARTQAYPGGVGHGGTARESDGSAVFATGIVDVRGRTSAGKPAGIHAWRLPLGSGESDGWS
jgi:hypothetical protein